MKKNGVYEMELADYKDIEATAHVELRTGKKIVMAAKLMLDHARLNIKQLGGKTMEEEDIIARKEQEEQLRNTTG